MAYQQEYLEEQASKAFEVLVQYLQETFQFRIPSDRKNRIVAALMLGQTDILNFDNSYPITRIVINPQGCELDKHVTLHRGQSYLEVNTVQVNRQMNKHFHTT
jgi:hypothetical protein